MIGFANIQRSKDGYYYGTKMVFELVKHERYAKMFYVRWEDGALSSDSYNETRAAELGRLMHIQKSKPRRLLEPQKEAIRAPLVRYSEHTGRVVATMPNDA
jgi:hypothetical protein